MMCYLRIHDLQVYVYEEIIASVLLNPGKIMAIIDLQYMTCKT